MYKKLTQIFKTMNNILVATDFSESSKNATEYAIQLATRAYSEITLFHVATLQVIDPVAPAFYLDTLIQEKKKDSINQLELVKSTMQQVLYPDNGSLKVHTKTAIGIPSSEISEMSSDSSVDLIVVGAKKGDFWARLTGSTVVDLLNFVDKPLLVVPEKARFEKINSIVVATNLEEGDTEFIKSVIAFAKTFNAHVLILHVNEVASEEDEEHFKILKKKIITDLEYGKVHFEIIRLKDSSRIIDLISEMDNADLLALRKVERGFVAELFHSSMTKDKIYNTKIPLLIYH